jgi:hypothetical protein
MKRRKFKAFSPKEIAQIRKANEASESPDKQTGRFLATINALMTILKLVHEQLDDHQMEAVFKKANYTPPWRRN